jgi:pantoate--beta-alanine ligase
VIVARTVAEARAALAALPRPLGLVPTMGALHGGHLSLVAAARERCAAVAASIFVNPTQFGPDEDFARYPRDEARDLSLFQEAGVAAVFTPGDDEMYPSGFATTVHLGGPLTESLEGASRPGHFDGVALVVAKLLAIVGPDVLFLGEKDAQQLAVLRRLARDLDLPVEVVGVPTMREPDGLAMSSRNAYLTADERAVAPDLYRALRAGVAAAEKPGAAAKDVVMAATAALLVADAADQADRRGEPGGSDSGGITHGASDDSAGGGRCLDPGTIDEALARPRFVLDYMAVVDADTFIPEGALGPRSRLVAAARLGTTRLIDTVSVAVTDASADPSPQSSNAHLIERTSS